MTSVEMCDNLVGMASPLLVIGAAYTGKSEMAHAACQAAARTAVIGTADLSEGLLRARVDELKRLRPSHWEHIEGQEDLGAQVRSLSVSGCFDQILLDSVNQWVAQHMLLNLQKYSLEQLSLHLEYLTKDLVSAIAEASCRIVLVSSEVGAGISPPRPIARTFRQLVGRINCRLAAACPSVIQVTAGIPLTLKGAALPSFSSPHFSRD